MTDGTHDLSVRVAAAHVLKDWVEAQYADLRAEQLADMNTLEREANVKTVTVEVPGIGDVATLTLPADKGKVQVVDSDAFAVAVEAFNPDAVETVIRVKPDVQKRILDKAKVLPGDGMTEDTRIVHVTQDGEMFPLDGVRHIPPREKGAASSFRMAFTKGDGDPTVPTPKEQLLAMVMSGGLSTILTPPAEQPAIESGDDAGAEQ